MGKEFVIMRKAIGLLALFGAALAATTGYARADTLILDTYGDGTAWGIGQTVTNSGAVGYHGGVGTLRAPNDPAQAAYAALPFTVNGLPAGQSAVSGVNIVFNVQPPASSTGSSHFEALRGAIFTAPLGAAALNATGVSQVGASFSFDTTASEDNTDPLNGSLTRGNGLTELLSAVNLSAAGITLTAGQSYFLVVEPKNGLYPSANDTLLDYGLWIARASTAITGGGAVLSNSYTTVRQAQDTFLTNNAGDALTLQNLGFGRGGATPGYFGAQISVAAPVGASVTGKVILEGVSDLSMISPSAPLGTFHVSFRTPGTATEVQGFDVTLTNLGATGTFSIPGAPTGTYDVNIKGGKNLSVTIPNVTVSGAAALPTVTLPAGDANDDNSVDTSDFGLLVGAYNGDATLPGSGYDPIADFNFDGVVDTTDFGILVGEYNNVGS